MKKNYIEGVAKLLDVEVGEVFQIDNDISLKNYIFKFADGFLQLSEKGEDDDTWVVANDSILIGLLYGNLSIRKLLWKPAFGEKYYTPSIDRKDFPFLYTAILWTDDRFDKKFYERGIVFKTKEEAADMAKKLLAFVKKERE